MEFGYSTFKEIMEYSDKGQRKVIRNYITEIAYLRERLRKLRYKQLHQQDSLKPSGYIRGGFYAALGMREGSRPCEGKEGHQGRACPPLLYLELLFC